MDELSQRFLEQVRRRRMFPEPGEAIVAVSGGPDSVALLDLLAGAAGSLGLTLLVAHADHQIQPESGSVAEQVRTLAARFGLPFELGRLGLGPGATETAARRARYRWLREVQYRRAARYLVTGHHQGDQVETVLLRVLHGSGPAGLAGMSTRGRGGLVRPLLPFTRSELAGHVAARGLPAHDDPANRDPRHVRSWIRATLLPLLESRLGEGVARNLVRAGRYAAGQRRGWDRALDRLEELSLHVKEGAFDVARAPLAGYDRALAAGVLSAAARRAGLVLGPQRARRLAAFAAKPSGRRLQLAGGWLAETSFDRLRVRSTVPVAPGAVVAAGERGEAAFGDFVLRWEPAPAPAALGRAGWTTWVGGSGWEVRSYQPGDRVVPLGGVGHRPVRRLLMEAHVPRGDRGSYPVVARGETSLWVPGICRSAAELPAPGTPAVRLDVIGNGESRPNGRA